ncbi:MAG: acyl-CoA desaturase [Methylococcaceae bacterium]|nr:acyl-CoA desaturase [Methylococcaceae bacterium]MDP2394561.1 acyl-CoA desaturase [Methylococcaceae bacterium]MDP3019954.1 acyl-CoA desaturase [Methylococcaceae bacterium]MDP3389259.1 acyl-CoA desaturase [Methylococcaceae bacterium]MDP3932269.1 acyl-CoA desaturase [Methylococcaceae bacterium]
MLLKTKLIKLFAWIDNSNISEADNVGNAIDWLRVIPFILMHVTCLLVFMVGWSPVALWVALFSYLLRMFAITAFYHRYFSHKSFKTSRAGQFIFALLGATATQRGPIWWASHHRRHHLYSDQDKDIHSPRHGFLWSHMGWFLCLKNFTTRENCVRDLLKYPELRWLDRFDIFVPIAYAFFMLGLGKWLEMYFPELGTNASQMLIWGYFVSSIVLIHCTLSVNSLAHIFGSKRYQTNDESRNNGLLALLTLGEGWHNNHHHYPLSTRQGFFWWEIDISYYLLKLMSWCGLIWDLQPVPVNRLHSKLVQKELQQ